MLSGEIEASEGRIALDGVDITGRAQSKRARDGVGRSYQRTTIFPEFSVHENCRLAAQAATPKPWAFWQSSQDCATSNASADTALEAAGLTHEAGRIAGTMSHGAQRQLEVAMCLATNPRVLLLDEPLAGMGAEETDRMLTLLARLKATHAILLVEHDMDAVFRIADRITVMVNGTVIATGNPEEIRENPEVRTAYLGEDH
jgi:branched-chain amino acid transport system ATP-binding protein